MRNFETKKWMLPGLSGILAILFGLVALFFPSITLIALAIYFAVTILVGGLILIIGSVRMKPIRSGRYLHLFEGIIGVFLGVIILARPEASVAVFVAVMGIWAMLLGLFFLIIFIRRPLPEFEKYFFLIAGIVSFIFGLLIAVNPFESSRIIVVLVGVYAVAYGVFTIIRTRKLFG